MSDQREFKVGDQVTIIKSGAKMYIRGYRGKHQVAISSSMDCEVAGVFDVSEITAGHRIDEPNHSDERLMEMPVSIDVDLAEKDAVREAFEKSEVYRQWAISGMPKDKQRLAFGVFEARQSEVDQLKNELLAQDKRMMRTFALVQQWRDEAVSPRLGFEPDITGTLESCADELEKALGGGV